jgi:hypothetical protein
MVCRLKGSMTEGWLRGRLANGCLSVAFVGGLCGEYREYCREQIEVKDATSGLFRAVTEDDLKGHTETERGPFDRTVQTGLPSSTTATTTTTTLPGYQHGTGVDWSVKLS